MNNLRRVNRFCGVGLRKSGVSILVINLQNRSVWRVTNHMLPCFLHRSQIKGNAWNAFWRFAHDLTLHWTRSDILVLRLWLYLASIYHLLPSVQIFMPSLLRRPWYQLMFLVIVGLLVASYKDFISITLSVIHEKFLQRTPSKISPLHFWWKRRSLNISDKIMDERVKLINLPKGREGLGTNNIVHQFLSSIINFLEIVVVAIVYGNSVRVMPMQ